MDRPVARAGRLQPQARTSTGARAPRRLRRVLAVTAFALAAFAVAGASTASASVAMCDVPITMSDGVVLRANIYLPSSTGHYPTVLTVTGYNKNAGNPTGECANSTSVIAGGETALAEKGFAVMVLDDRGTGDSGGKWESWGERTQQDYKEVLDWIQAQGWSDGSVATHRRVLHGHHLAADRRGRRGAREGRQAARGQGGLGRHPDGRRLPRRDLPGRLGRHAASSRCGSGSSTGSRTCRRPRRPKTRRKPRTVYLEHLLGNAEFSVSHILGAALGEEDAYDGPFYRLRSPVVRAGEITVPVVIQGGWWDLFQRGEPLLWESLKNSKDRVLFMSAALPHHLGPGL